MNEKLKYFILNNAYEFRRGKAENMTVDGDCLRFESEHLSGLGKYLTRVFDSGERGTIWHRLLINTENCQASELRITVYASDELDFVCDGKICDVDSVIHDENMPLSKIVGMLEPFVKKQVKGAADALLHDVRGRYLWIYTEVFAVSDKPATIKDIKVYLPAVSWIDYLPEIYRNSDTQGAFLERYLGIFQTLYEEIEDEIDRITERFDPESADVEFLRWLAEWLDISDCSVWEEEKLRKLLLMSFSLYRSRGTKESVSKVIELYTGEKPYIIESFMLQQFAGTELYEKTLLPIYGDDPNKVLILVRSEVIKSKNDINVLRRITREMMPLTVNFELKVLEEHISLDKFTYLGVNSYLGKPETAALNGKSRITFSVLGE